MQSGLFLVSLAQGAAECGVGGFPENPESNSVTKLERRHFSFSIKMGLLLLPARMRCLPSPHSIVLLLPDTVVLALLRGSLYPAVATQPSFPARSSTDLMFSTSCSQLSSSPGLVFSDPSPVLRTSPSITSGHPVATLDLVNVASGSAAEFLPSVTVPSLPHCVLTPVLGPARYPRHICI